MARAIVRALLRHILGAAGLLLCLGVQANTLGIVTSGQGAAYDEFVEAVRQELERMNKQATRNGQSAVAL